MNLCYIQLCEPFCAAVFDILRCCIWHFTNQVRSPELCWLVQQASADAGKFNRAFNAFPLLSSWCALTAVTAAACLNNWWNPFEIDIGHSPHVDILSASWSYLLSRFVEALAWHQICAYVVHIAWQSQASAAHPGE